MYTSPDAAPIEAGTVVVAGGRISAVGADVRVPSDARLISGAGRIVTPGFWNAHVHFSEPKWSAAARAPAPVVNGWLREMVTRRGFTTVVDTGSDPRSTLSLRRRIEAGELLGPSILTSGSGLYPPHGVPYYLRETIPFWIRPFLPTPSSPARAERIVRRNIARGADLLKLFTGSYVARGQVTTMPEPIARAAAEVAHAHGQLVYSHASNLEGTKIAIRSGVDILAHPPDTTEGVDPTVLRQAVERRMGMIPTLKMFASTVSTSPAYLDPIHDVVREFSKMGGQLLFGTDVGFMTDYDTEDEFRALERSGLDYRSILRALTTAPAERFGRGTGTLTVGAPGDLVLLDKDPRDDIRAFSRVRGVVRGGRVQYAS